MDGTRVTQYYYADGERFKTLKRHKVYSFSAKLVCKFAQA